VDEGGHRERERFFAAARAVAGLTMLSRVFGLVRDMAIVALGATRATDAFWTAFSVPNLFRRLFGEGALAAAFVPVFTDVLESADGHRRARLVLANAAGLLTIVLAGLVVLGEVLLAIWLAAAPGAWDRALLLRLLMIMLPFMFTICLLALGSAALNCRGHFAYPAFAPIVLNVCLIAAAVFARARFAADDRAALTLLSAAVIFAGVVQLAGVVWLLRTVDLAVVPRLRPLLREVRRIARLVLPMTVPLGVMQFSAFFDRIYAWFMTATEAAPRLELFGGSIARPLAPGVVTCLYAANRMYQFPLGILAISIATVVFPLFSRYAARGDTEGLRQTTQRAIRLGIFLGLPAGVGLGLLAGSAIALIFQHGDFTAHDAARSTRILQMYCLGMWAYFCNHVLLRAFFAQQDARTPLKVTALLAGVNIVLVATLVFTPLRAAAVGAATATTASATTVVLTWALRRRWGRLGLRGIFFSAAKTAAATAVMAAVVWAAVRTGRGWGQAVAERLGATWTGEVVVVVLAVIGGAVTFAVAAWLLRCSELKELLRSARRGGPENPSSPPAKA